MWSGVPWAHQTQTLGEPLQPLLDKPTYSLPAMPPSLKQAVLLAKEKGSPPRSSRLYPESPFPACHPYPPKPEGRCLCCRLMDLPSRVGAAACLRVVWRVSLTAVLHSSNGS